MHFPGEACAIGSGEIPRGHGQYTWAVLVPGGGVK